MPWKKIAEVLGVRDGGSVRALAGNLLSALRLDKLLASGPGDKSVAFTVALVALCAKLSKADGVTLNIEAEAFEQIYKVPEAERPSVRRLYDLAKQDVAGFEIYARRIARLLKDEPELKNNVLYALFYVALADGVLHETEEAYLRYVAEEFGCSTQDYRAIKSLFVDDADDPYVVLGIAPDCTDDQLKSHYRKLLRENHPDTLLAAGVPDAAIEIAQAKTAAINVAYDRIVTERRA